MIINLTKTNSSAISSAVRKARRHEGTGGGMVFTLIVVCTARRYDAALEAALEAGREHPSRIILAVTGTGTRDRLDAEIRLGEGVPGDVITLRLAGEIAAHADSVVLPLLLPDSPVVVWWPNESPAEPGNDPIGRLADRRITDASGVADPMEALRTRARFHSPGDTDLTWTRVTPWRALLAAAVDQYPSTITGATVEADRNNAPAELMASWLQARLGIEVVRTSTGGPGITGVRLHTAAGDLAVLRTDGLMASYEVPGQPQRTVALKRRSMTQLLTEELRRMDADDIFEQATATLLGRWDAERAAAAPRAKKSRATKAATKKAPATTASRTKAVASSQAPATKRAGSKESQ